MLPLKTGRTGVYSTSKTPVAALTSYGEVQMDRMEKSLTIRDSLFRIQVLRLLKRAPFIGTGSVKAGFSSPPISMAASRVWMVENGQLCPESRFLRLHVDRRMDPNTKTLVGPLMEMLEVVIAEQTISPLLKAYLHMEIVELMKKKPAAWGVALSGQLLQDYEALLSKVKVRIRPTDWMDGQAYKGIGRGLGSILRSVGKEGLFPRIAFYFGFAQSVAKN